MSELYLNVNDNFFSPLTLFSRLPRMKKFEFPIPNICYIRDDSKFFLKN